MRNLIGATADTDGMPCVEPNMYFISGDFSLSCAEPNALKLLMHLVRHVRRALYESVAAPVSNNAADLVELNNVAVPN